MKGECGCSGSSSCKSDPPHYHHHNYPAYHRPTNSYPASVQSLSKFTFHFHGITYPLKTLEANHYLPSIGNCGSDCSCSSCK